MCRNSPTLSTYVSTGEHSMKIAYLKSIFVGRTTRASADAVKTKLGELANFGKEKSSTKRSLMPPNAPYMAVVGCAASSSGTPECNAYDACMSFVPVKSCVLAAWLPAQHAWRPMQFETMFFQETTSINFRTRASLMLETVPSSRMQAICIGMGGAHVAS